MRLLEELFGYLAKVVDKANGGVLFQWIVNVVNVGISLVKEVMKDVCRLDCSRSYKVKPMS